MARIGYLLAKGAFDRLREKMDPRKVNGGVFLGLNGIVIKSHGGTDAEGFAAADRTRLRHGRATACIEKIEADLEHVPCAQPHAAVQAGRRRHDDEE